MASGTRGKGLFSLEGTNCTFEQRVGRSVRCGGKKLGHFFLKEIFGKVVHTVDFANEEK